MHQRHPTYATASAHEAAPTFRIFIACDDKAAFMRARKIQRQVEALYGQGVHIRPVCWNFALLRHPGLRDCAAAEAAKSEMIIVSAAGRSGLPPHVKLWAEQIPARRRNGEAAFVLLLGSETETVTDNSQDIAHLRGVAESRRLDFLCNLDHRRARELAAPGFGVFGWALAPAILISDRIPRLCGLRR